MTYQNPEWLSDGGWNEFTGDLAIQKQYTGSVAELFINKIGQIFHSLDDIDYEHLLDFDQLCKRDGVILAPQLSDDAGVNLERIFSTERNPKVINPLDEIPRGEGSTQEFKSSFFTPLSQEHVFKNNDIPDERKKELIDEVTFSWLKAVAALANFKGGLLWIGVKDSAGKTGESLSVEDITGVEEDFKSHELAIEDRDTFQQLISNHLRDSFKPNMQNHCEISWHELFGRTIVSIQISQRRDKFVLVKYPNKTLRNKYALGYGLFIRANEGSGTPVEFDDYEEVERLRTARAKNS